ncbi:MAG: hypothetical protein GY801_11475 [bacterium]|nr:hypothetical protein [bacterium]
MHRWIVRDRDGREIYLTEERWEHIVQRHGELQNHLDDVLNAVRRGRRQQQPQDPQTYVYRLPSDALSLPFNGILVVVTFRFERDDSGKMSSNNFIVTAWGIMMRS